MVCGYYESKRIKIYFTINILRPSHQDWLRQKSNHDETGHFPILKLWDVFTVVIFTILNVLSVKYVGNLLLVVYWPEKQHNPYYGILELDPMK